MAGRSASTLSSREVQVLSAALRKDCFWVKVSDGFVLADGWYTRAGRAMRNCGYIRQAPGEVAWLPYVSGAGKNKRDEPARLMEITPEGKALLRRFMGPDTYDQLEKLARESCRWREPGQGPAVSS